MMSNSTPPFGAELIVSLFFLLLEKEMQLATMNNQENLMKKALWLSIEHWLKNWEDPMEAICNADACACCRLYLDRNCMGCPISEKTGSTLCTKTPYREAADAILEYAVVPSQENYEIARRACENEYRFLVELALEGSF